MASWGLCIYRSSLPRFQMKEQVYKEETWVWGSGSEKDAWDIPRTVTGPPISVLPTFLGWVVASQHAHLGIPEGRMISRNAGCSLVITGPQLNCTPSWRWELVSRLKGQPRVFSVNLCYSQMTTGANCNGREVMPVKRKQGSLAFHSKFPVGGLPKVHLGTPVVMYRLYNGKLLSCVQFLRPHRCSLPGSSVHRIL